MSTTAKKDKPTPQTALGKLGAEIESAVRGVDVDWIDGIVDRHKVLANGMMRFELEGPEARMSCTVFSKTAEGLPAFTNGSRVRVKLGRLDFYAPHCRVSGIVDEVEVQ